MNRTNPAIDPLHNARQYIRNKEDSNKLSILRHKVSQMHSHKQDKIASIEKKKKTLYELKAVAESKEQELADVKNELRAYYEQYNQNNQGSASQSKSWINLF
jgi:hypothetical protein